MVFKNKKGISAIIGSILLIAMVLVIGGIVWGVVTNLVSEQLEEAGNCFEAFDKVEINNQFTCFNSSASPQETLFSINVKDVELSQVVVFISGGGSTKSYTLTPTGSSGNVDTWPNPSGNAILPGENSGSTFFTTDFTSKPSSISVHPVVGGNQCDASDTLSVIEDCIFLA